VLKPTAAVAVAAAAPRAGRNVQRKLYKVDDSSDDDDDDDDDDESDFDGSDSE